MAARYEKVYQFKVSLNNIEPMIWRCIQVPETYSFLDYVAIQDAMGWFDYHLHEFNIPNPITGKKECIGIPDEEPSFLGEKISPGWKLAISDYFSEKTKVACYTYDFGDNWEHTIRLEKILPRESGVRYPKCLDGARTCPPEDCGSVPGYYRLLAAMDNPKDEQYESMVQWLGYVYKPEEFSSKVRFSNPKDALKMKLEG